MENLKIFNEQQAGEYLGGSETPISVRSMQRYRQEGSGPKFRIIGGRTIRYLQSDLDEYLDERICKSTLPLEHTQPSENSGDECND
jgi:predicted DNA-binding transcriptional regulator AlpA